MFIGLVSKTGATKYYKTKDGNQWKTSYWLPTRVDLVFGNKIFV